MKKQLLMCIRNVNFLGIDVAKKGQTYTLRESAKCSSCGKTFVSVEEVIHPVEMECVEGDDWMLGGSFIPLNDPDYQNTDEKDEVKAPQHPTTIH